MNELKLKQIKSQRRANRVRSHVRGNASRPRLSVFISLSHVSAQIIDDENSKTLAQATTIGQKSLKGSMTDKAKWVGTEVAKKAKVAKVKQVVLDRGNKLYHGRVKALADAAREGGLEF